MNGAELRALSMGYFREGSGYLYAVECANGTVKVGCTRKPGARLPGLLAETTRMGAPLVRYELVETRRRPVEAEREALARMPIRPRPGTREWFPPGAWDAAVAAIKAAAA